MRLWCWAADGAKPHPRPTGKTCCINTASATPPSGAPPVSSSGLQRQVGVTARWLETASRTTAENASLSASILHPLGKRRIALVTNAWHMQRAEAVFAHTGFVVTPAPMGYFSAKEGLIAWLPSAAMLANSAQLWREAIGQQAYRWHRYRTSLNTDITPHPPTSQPVSRP